MGCLEPGFPCAVLLTGKGKKEAAKHFMPCPARKRKKTIVRWAKLNQNLLALLAVANPS
jgi:hypothetical protein